MTVSAAAIYVRISSDPEERRRGVERQEQECRALAEQLGWPVARLYEDNDISAMGKRKRPEFEQLLLDVAEGRIDAVISWHVDRLYRRAADLVRIIDTFNLRGIPLQTVTSGGLDLSTPTARMHARIGSAVAEYEVEHSRERMKLAHRKAAEAGEWRARRRVFGYKLGGHEVEPIEAQSITLAAADILGGVSTGAIARRWNEQGLTTSGKRLVNSLGEKIDNGGSVDWNSRRVVQLLRNPTYARRVTYNGEVLPGIVGQWPRVLDDGVFDALAAFLDNRRQPRTKDRVWQGSSVYRCGSCDPDENGVYPKMEVAGRAGVPHYRCRIKGHNNRSQRRLDDYIDSIVVARLSRPDAADLLDKGAEVDVPALSAQRDGLQARLDQLAIMFSDGDIDGSQLRAGSRPLRDQITAIDAQLAAQARRDPVAELLLSGDDIAQAWKEIGPDRRSKIIDVLMRVIVLPVDRPGGGPFDTSKIVIEWKR